MSDSTCRTCLRLKPCMPCQSCQEHVCKECRQFLDESTFSFLKEIPQDLSHMYYCSPCFQAKIEPALESYNEIVEKAKSVYIFFVTQRKAPPVLKKSKETIHIKECRDRDETILRLAFRAVEQGYNAVIEAEVSAKKIRNAGYQKSDWSGVGVAAEVRAETIARWSE